MKKLRSFIPKKLRPEVTGSNFSVTLGAQDVEKMLKMLSINDVLCLSSRRSMIKKITKANKLLQKGDCPDLVASIKMFFSQDKLEY